MGEAQQKITSLLKKYRFSPQKKFGQNFLISDHAIKILSQALDLSQNDLILEIGAGSGYHAAIVSIASAEKGARMPSYIRLQYMPRPAFP